MAATAKFASGVSLAALPFVLGGCGSGSKVSSASMLPRLVPARSLPGFNRVATLDWSNPIDLVGQGVPLPEPTYPSAAVKEFQAIHLKAATGEVLRQGSGLQAIDVVIGVAEFNSAADAAKAQTWMHMQDAQQPCFGTCILSPLAVRITEVPKSTAVIQKLVEARPSDPAN
jgi:hypothetical protein